MSNLNSTALLILIFLYLTSGIYLWSTGELLPNIPEPEEGVLTATAGAISTIWNILTAPLQLLTIDLYFPLFTWIFRAIISVMIIYVTIRIAGILPFFG